MINVQYITHCNKRFGYVEGAELALKGGCRWIQLRMKDSTDEKFLKTGLIVRKMCKSYNATFVIDDRVHLVKALEADGIHLGKNDMPVDEAKKLLQNDNIIIGGTANTFEDIVQLNNKGADYIGCGPFRYTETKKNLAPLLGIEGYIQIINNMKQHGISIPVIAIGGITYENVIQIMETGVRGIAISGAILNAEDPEKEMRRIIKL